MTDLWEKRKEFKKTLDIPFCVCVCNSSNLKSIILVFITMLMLTVILHYLENVDTDSTSTFEYIFFSCCTNKSNCLNIM